MLVDPVKHYFYIWLIHGWGDKSCSDIQITFHHQLLQIPNKLRKFAKGTRKNALWSC